MARQARKVKYSILIVCEGTVSEPSYFWGLKNEVSGLEDGLKNTVITIDPRPREDTPQGDGSSPHKTARKKRELQNRESVVEGEVEPEYKATTVSHVRIAQFGLRDGTHDEAYAVFDKDGHTKRKEAFDLAAEEINGKKVQIGFSSISFEFWVLLHFEPSTFAFEKAECKDESGRYLGCGAPRNSIGCAGKRCAAGYIREQRYFPFEKTRLRLWGDLRDKLTAAFRNAALVRHYQESKNPDLPVYERNPYSDLDLVIGKILGLKDFIVMEIGHPRVLNGFEYTVTQSGNGQVSCMVKNKQDVSQICNLEAYFSDQVSLKAGANSWKKLLQPGDSTTFAVDIPLTLDRPPRFINLDSGAQSILVISLLEG